MLIRSTLKLHACTSTCSYLAHCKLIIKCCKVSENKLGSKPPKRRFGHSLPICYKKSNSNTSPLGLDRDLEFCDDLNLIGLHDDDEEEEQVKEDNEGSDKDKEDNKEDNNNKHIIMCITFSE